MRTLHDLPRFSDRWAYLYLEMGRLDKGADGLSFENEAKKCRVPIDQLSLVMLGPGTSITHQAAKVLADNNCLAAWTGQEGIRLYSHSTGGTNSSRRLIAQAALVSDLDKRERIARRMYTFRFAEDIEPRTSIETLRGKEGYRVRSTYQRLAEEFGVDWQGRNYKPGEWDYADPLNRAISAANACLNGVVHAGIVSAGYSAGLGFIHTGKMLSFVYDIADLYKMDLTVPLAFRLVAEGFDQLEREIREACREEFYRFKLMERLLPDIQEVLDVGNDLRECDNELEGRVISLADRDTPWGFPRESEQESARYPMGESDREA